MGISDALSGVKTKVYTKMGKQEGDVILQVVTGSTAPSVNPYGTTGHTKTVESQTFTTGVKVEYAPTTVSSSIKEPSKAYDALFYVPRTLLTVSLEGKLTDAMLIYMGKKWQVVNVRTGRIIGNKPTEYVLEASRNG